MTTAVRTPARREDVVASRVVASRVVVEVMLRNADI
jgi:hypothetical protein